MSRRHLGGETKWWCYEFRKYGTKSAWEEEFYSVHDKSEVPQNTHVGFIGNWPCKSEGLERPKLEGDEGQPLASR